MIKKFFSFLSFFVVISSYAAVTGIPSVPDFSAGAAPCQAAYGVACQTRSAPVSAGTTVAPCSSSAVAGVCYSFGKGPIIGSFVYQTVFVANTVFACPPNSTLTNGQCTCSANFIEDGPKASCVSAHTGCPSSGTSETKNFTLGYSNSPNDSSDVSGLIQPVQGSSTCASGGVTSCNVTVGPIAMAWSSLTPTAQGLYRISGDYTVTHTGTACTPTTSQRSLTDSASAPPACPGTWGTVNGKPVCIPGSTLSRTAVPATTAPNRSGNPIAGSSGNSDLPSRQPTAASGTGNGGNAGSAPSTSDGSTLPARGLAVSPTIGTTVGASSSSGGIAASDLADIKTDCDKYPSSIGCSQYGSASSQSLPSQDSGFSSITSVAFASSATCPAAQNFNVLGNAYAISFQPICNTAQSYIQPVVLILAASLASFIFIGGFKS